jgi:CRISPR/Cas system endoribonuclease Cas6 (RAMP superfamily)
MKIAIAKYHEVENTEFNWQRLNTYELYPDEVRKIISFLLKKEVEDSIEYYFSTLDPIVISMIQNGDFRECDLSYDDVYLLSEGKLIPLLSKYSSDYLTHFDMMDLFARNELCDVSDNSRRGE